MYKKIDNHFEQCVTCQVRSNKKSQMDIQPYPFANIGLDLLGPHPTLLSGIRYIVSFIDLYSGWPETFPIADKSADNIVHILLEEIIPRFGCPLQIATDNGTEYSPLQDLILQPSCQRESRTLS